MLFSRGAACPPASVPEINAVHVDLTEADLRRLGDLWPALQGVGDDRAAADMVVARFISCLEGREAAERLVADLYAFSRQLGQTQDLVALSRLVLDTMADRLHAHQASMALYDESLGRLRIVATHGYPAVLVEDLRIRPGAGLIGEVFLSRRPRLVEDAARELGPSRRRRRYRTGSFIALPLAVAVQGLGAAAFADRSDLRPFTRSDLTLARAMAAPAALALAAARLAAVNRELALAAAVDPLTSLYNRRYFETRLDEEIQRARRYGLDLALLMIDADNFKSFNDRFGHLVGDQVLRAISDTLRRSVRAFDVCTRFGGEEFAILMPGSSPTSALQSAERIRHRIEHYEFETLAVPADSRPTISIGVAVLNGDHTAHDLMARADRALYAAKAAGKNCVRLSPE
jgi:diguanylate cyclase (GGDEF)-like protein